MLNIFEKISMIFLAHSTTIDMQLNKSTSRITLLTYLKVDQLYMIK